MNIELNTYKLNCVRCNKQYEIPNHPTAHCRSICEECHKEKPEDIHDQSLASYKRYKIINFII